MACDKAVCRMGEKNWIIAKSSVSDCCTYAFNPFMLSGFFYLNSLDQSISSLRVSRQFLLLPCFIKMPVINANSVDANQMPRSAA